jgi:DNA-binding transcriptional ArsR family regulator
MDDNVILDEKSFKALSAESRVGILKKLRERRMTLSELSTRLNLRGSTVKEHCTILQNAELIKKIDEGRKWKYYELTGKGKQIVAPSFMEEAKVFITLCIGAVVFAGIIMIALQGITMQQSFGTPLMTSEKNIYDNLQTSGTNPEITTITSDLDNTETKDVGSESREITSFNTNSTNIMLATLIILVIGIFIGWTARKKI